MTAKNATGYRTAKKVGGRRFRLHFEQVPNGERAGQWQLNAYLVGDSYPFLFCVYPTEAECLALLKRKARR